MKRLSGLLIAALVLVVACDKAAMVDADHPVVEREGQADIVGYASGEPKMEKAISEAKAKLGYFFEHAAAPAAGEQAFALKVGFPVTSADGTTHEHIWVDGVQNSGDGFTAVLANEPNWMTGKKLGDQVTFTEDMISDWGFFRDGKMIGYYTTRAMLDDGDPAEAAAIMSMLGENPT